MGVEAENFFMLTGNARKVDLSAALEQGGMGFAVALGHQAKLEFPHVFGWPTRSHSVVSPHIVFHLLGGVGRGEIVVEDYGNGDRSLLARCPVHMPVTDDVSCPIQLRGWEHTDMNLAISFNAMSADDGTQADKAVLHIDWFQVVFEHGLDTYV